MAIIGNIPYFQTNPDHAKRWMLKYVPYRCEIIYLLLLLPSGYWTIAMENPPIFKNGKPSISMGHLYHSYVSHSQRVLQFVGAYSINLLGILITRRIGKSTNQLVFLWTKLYFNHIKTFSRNLGWGAWCSLCSRFIGCPENPSFSDGQHWIWARGAQIHASVKFWGTQLVDGH